MTGGDGKWCLLVLELWYCITINHVIDVIHPNIPLGYRVPSFLFISCVSNDGRQRLEKVSG